MARIKLFKTSGRCMYPLIKEGTILCVKQEDICRLKEGTIVVVDTKEGYIGHILFSVGGINKHQYLITSSLKSPKLDKLNPIRKFIGTVLKSYDTKSGSHNIRILTPPFLIILIRNLMSLSYFVCSFIFNMLKLNLYKIHNISQLIIEECKKWRLVWLYFYLRRL